ncbi:helix-turn-helix domain-containing protein [Enterococcus raffinosus]|uniref:Helix-turn-helix domain-containing protein n=1 Tax=Enterococcus raffinosus TaxID=71452 RepID=A0AAW8T6U8_9ENTE|nr:helix-turn-helix domain-containing protein [Enterococcus raffinosus]MDT2523283.1 helix-turn-helix domain-containing protein [Enterococcus raffinosus]MDT2529268.1 helix-turn-helix domain-containing protein [Enterococcus raffinosus]MDT2534122.1 helix-turn-helix domain-containing protein [Enterococcus raffinosus]MDT2543434.1 helix-turn-helix domain-containing protein [Enterococcus raffinosus]MDT2555158.1 helix-turn-helix domain-containing protein [Enterococcus raffinosus]
MNIQKNPIANNLRSLRNRNNWSLEYVAEKLEVSRQAVAKWESGESLPDVLKCDALANLYEVTLTDLIRHNQEEEGVPIGPAGKHIFGIVPVGARGQIVLPKKARDLFNIETGDTLVVLGDTNPAFPGIALIDSQSFIQLTGNSLEPLFNRKEES